jgi:MFS family permease
MANASQATPAATGQKTIITKYMWLVLITTMLGWGLDATDGTLYSMVVQPAMKELLGASATPAQIGYYGGLNIAMYLVGWAVGGIAFGILADYFGRVRILSIGILWFAVFTALTGFATVWWHIGVLRFLTGLGSGVESILGANLISETWNNKYRPKAVSFMMSAYALGAFLAAFIYRIVGPYGWRYVFFVGILPSLVVLVIRRHIHEPEAFEKVRQRRKQLKLTGQRSEDDKKFLEFTLLSILRGKYLKFTCVCMAMSVCALIGTWAIGGWIPSIIKEVLQAQGIAPSKHLALVAYSSMVYSIGGWVGYVTWGFITERIGRKPTFAINLLGSLVLSPILFLYVRNQIMFLCGLFIIGFTFFGYFGGMAVYVPELYPPRMRATALSFVNGSARVLTAFGPFVTGMLVAPFGSFAKAAAAISSIYLIGAIALIFAKETRGLPLPED